MPREPLRAVCPLDEFDRPYTHTHTPTYTISLSRNESTLEIIAYVEY